MKKRQLPFLEMWKGSCFFMKGIQDVIINGYIQFKLSCINSYQNDPVEDRLNLITRYSFSVRSQRTFEINDL